MIARVLITAALLTSSIAAAQGPVITTQPANTTITLGQPVTFSVQAAGASRYQWQRDGVNTIAGATSSTYTFTPTEADTGHIFNVIVYAANGGAAGSVSAWLHVTPRLDTPSVTNVENFGTTTASLASDSFGLGVDSNQPWEFSAVAAMHGTWVRADGCQWEKIEVQAMPGNTSGGFAPAKAPDCLSEVTSAAQYALHLDALSYFAPPSSQIATAVVKSDVPAGSYAVPLTVTSGTLSGYNPRSLLISGTSALRDRVDYGAPVDSISGTTLNLPEPSIAMLPAGTVLQINALLYPPVLIAPQTNPTAYVSDPSVQAWLQYVHAVQTFLQTEGVTGAVEMWNEPEQSNELWDFAPAFYATQPAHFDIGGTGRALAYAAATLPAIPGVRLLNGWTNLSGGSSLYNNTLLSSIPVSYSQVNSVFLGEAIHPYGNNPEQQSWIPSALQSDANAGVQNPWIETPIGGQIGANFKSAAWYDASPYAQGGLKVSVSETGIQMGITPSETEQQRTRFDLRQFLAMSGNHIFPIIFYKAGNDSSWEWFAEDAAHTPHPVVAAFTGLLSDINAIANTPVAAYSDATMPQVTSYTGYYPLATVNMVGSRAGDNGNSILSFAWQKTYTVPPAATNSQDENYGAAASWTTLVSPAPVPVQVAVPSGYGVSFVKDLVTQTSVAYTLMGNVLTYSVSDNPIEVRLLPGTAAKTATVTVGGASAVYGAATASLNATVTYTSSSAPTGAFTFMVGSGSKVTASCTTSSHSTKLCSATYPINGWNAGYYSVTGSEAADSTYASASNTGTLTLTQSSPALTVANTTSSASQTSTLLTATLAYAGGVAPGGALAFQVGSGPAVAAQCTGNGSPLTCSATYPLASALVGSNLIAATLATDNNYRGASSTAILTVTGIVETVTVSDASASYRAPAVTLAASVAYTGTIVPFDTLSLQVAGGPAVTASCVRISSPLLCSALYNPSTLAPGSYPILATLATNPKTTVSLHAGTLFITPAVSSLSVANENIRYGTPSTTLYVNVVFNGPVSPTGAVTFSIDGGPAVTARYTGSTTTPRTAITTYALQGLGVGRHTITASLAADSNYKATTANGALVVSQ